MLATILQTLVFIVTLLLLITVHEYGHYWVAKRVGVKVLRFSLGFGKPIWRRVGKDGTQYVIAILPLGGYVRLLDEREMPVKEAELPMAFNRQPLWARTLVALAGPFVNLAFSVLIFTAVWMIGVEQPKPVIGSIVPDSIAAQSQLPAGVEIVGVDGHPVHGWQKIIIYMLRHIGDQGAKLHVEAQGTTPALKSYVLPLANWSIEGREPDPLQNLGIVPYHPPGLPIIHKLRANGPAILSGLKIGDRLLSVDGQVWQDWLDFSKYIQHHPEKVLHFKVQRGKAEMSFSIEIASRWAGLHKIGYLGVEVAPLIWPPNTKYYTQLPFWGAALQAIHDVWDISVFNVIILEKMLTSKLSMQSLGGPIAIYQTSGVAFQQGLVAYLGFMALLSAALGCLNLMPFPGLDGGHLLFFAIEAVMRRPIPPRLEALVLRIGFVLLIVLMIHVTINDVFRIIQ